MRTHLPNSWVAIVASCTFVSIHFSCNGISSTPANKSGSFSDKSLAFNIQKQSALHLCWAAVTSSVSKFYDQGSPYTQCDLANYALGMTDCCKDLNKCDSNWYLNRAMTYTMNLASSLQGMPSFDIIKNEITNNRLVCVRIEWRNSAGHFVVIHGFHDNGDIDVQDPWPTKNPGRIPLTELQIFYQDLGSITHYYLTKPATDSQ
jgi:hypothetical protein